ncbi:MAG: hypothetical protein JO128_22715 [Alphaproteobacteria bacterium]|nr:hypothetical protein [Alphaproteobacteria bacterium]
MPGTFRYPFGDPETTGYFGGYRRPQSTSADALSAGPLSDAAPMPSAASPDVLRYPSGQPVMDFNTGKPFPWPDRLDMQNNIATGRMMGRLAASPKFGDVSNPDLNFASLFLHGSEMDYQRPLNHPEGPFDPNMTNVSAYNTGVVGAAAGYDLEYLLNGSGLYNLWRGRPENAATSYGLSKERALSIKQGYDDYKAGRWSRSDDGGDLLNSAEP